jgi:hypothetical protein
MRAAALRQKREREWFQEFKPADHTVATAVHALTARAMSN